MPAKHTSPGLSGDGHALLSRKVHDRAVFFGKTMQEQHEDASVACMLVVTFERGAPDA